MNTKRTHRDRTFRSPNQGSHHTAIPRSDPQLGSTAYRDRKPYTLALFYAYAQDKVSSELPDDLQELNTEGMRSRTVLFVDTTALATRGLIPSDSLSKY